MTNREAPCDLARAVRDVMEGWMLISPRAAAMDGRACDHSPFGDYSRADGLSGNFHFGMGDCPESCVQLVLRTSPWNGNIVR